MIAEEFGHPEIQRLAKLTAQRCGCGQHDTPGII
jgi:hypothetical protein